MKDKTKIFMVLLIGIGTVLLSSLILQISAQNQGESQALTVSPPTQEVTVDPGKSIIITAKVRNNSKRLLPISVHIEDFTASGDEGQVALVNQGNNSIAKWTKIDTNQFNLNPGESRDVLATITVPNGQAGGRYGSFVFSVQGEKQSNSASLAQEVASLFLIKISGAVDEHLTTDSFTAPKFSEFGPIPLSVKLTNSGNIFVKAYGLINITNMFGQKEADIVVNGTNIFPGASRVITTTFDKKFLFGTYTATTVLYYGEKNQPINFITHFTVIPVRLIAIALIIILIIFLMRKRLIKAFKVLAK